MTFHIVTGVDGTATATEAARAAARLAQGVGGTLHVISAYGNVGDQIDVHVEGHDFVVTPKNDAQRIADEAAAILKAEFASLEVETAPAEGKPAEALVRVAEELDADIIVVGNKRVQGLARVLGSIAADVAHKAHCDVYIANTHPRE
jgi:nucleotide-binding universal stress UspA family protein